MKLRYVVGVAAVLMVCVVVAVGQSQTQVSPDAPRAPWGEPDLQGIWNSSTIGPPRERPAEWADREFLTEEEVQAIEQERERSAIGIGRDVRAQAGTPEDVEGAYNNVFTGVNVGGFNWDRSRRTSQIIDPPDGRMPPLTDSGIRIQAASAEARFGRAGADGDEPPEPILDRDGNPVTLTYVRPGGAGKDADGNLLPGVDYSGRRNDNPEDRNDIERCRGLLRVGPRGFSQIVQSPGYITWYQEQGHGGGGYRIIQTDGRPHAPEDVRFVLGDSVGHWEGDTLVIDTTNFLGETTDRGTGGQENMRLIERLTRLNETDLRYQVTTISPDMHERPYTTERTLMLQDAQENMIYETYCYEGNYALTSMLAGARLEEVEAAANTR